MYVLHTARKMLFNNRAALIVGLAVQCYSTWVDGFQTQDLRPVGVVLVLAALARMIVFPALRPQEDLYQAGYDLGYDKGFHAGHRQARPVVVAMHDYTRQQQAN